MVIMSLSTCKPQEALQAGSSLKLPAQGQYYHGVYPGGRTGEEDDIQPSDLKAYEQSVGRKVAWVYFSNNWYRSRAFPLETASWIREAGALPFIRLMLRSSPETDIAEPVFMLERIVQGDFDADLAAWGKAAASFATPLIVEWGTEMNGRWFSWNGVWNGKAEGTRLFQESYRHIVETLRAAGATNIIWVFHVNADDDPAAAWNDFENYYPGDDVVDWLGVSLYTAQTPQDDYWTDFQAGMDEVMPRLEQLAPDKPIFLLEFGATEGNPLGSPAAWADAALQDILSDRWPALKGFSWWNETWQNDDNASHDTNMQVQSVPGLADVFRQHLTSKKAIDHPLFSD